MTLHEHLRFWIARLAAPSRRLSKGGDCDPLDRFPGTVISPAARRSASSTELSLLLLTHAWTACDHPRAHGCSPDHCLWLDGHRFLSAQRTVQGTWLWILLDTTTRQNAVFLPEVCLNGPDSVRHQ